MWKRYLLLGLLLCGMLALVTHHQHSLTPDDLVEGQQIKCTACLHGKVTLTHSVPIVFLEVRQETVESPSTRSHRSIQRFTFPSRAPPGVLIVL